MKNNFENLINHIAERIKGDTGLPIELSTEFAKRCILTVFLEMGMSVDLDSMKDEEPTDTIIVESCAHAALLSFSVMEIMGTLMSAAIETGIEIFCKDNE